MTFTPLGKVLNRGSYESETEQCVGTAFDYGWLLSGMILAVEKAGRDQGSWR